MNSEIRYRQANADDIPAMSAIRLMVRENVLRNPAAITPQMYLDYLSKLGRGWVGELDGRIVGFSYADRQDNSIWALFIHPDFEGRGIGTALLHLATGWLFAEGARRIALGTTPDTRADRFYKALGWVRGEMRNAGEVEFTLRCPSM
ncbi:GNAT family N-acetyltransferase [Pseudoduganella sp. RAF53_2]|uniref:GNAT family N-acetyltransferase n=1 Tax=unclassified Pseudoduganella TaxID=2637179 RepID=UPI003F9DE1FA